MKKWVMPVTAGMTRYERTICYDRKYIAFGQGITMQEIALHRLQSQQLLQTEIQTPEAMVAWLGAVQSQEYAFAKWALHLRMPNVSDEVIEQAFSDGAILRTHVMRPTWHFVTPADIRWLLELTAPRVHAFNATYYRKLELDEALLARSHDVITKALEGGKQLTRVELAEALKQAGIDPGDSMRLGLILHHAELEALICSGGRRGKQFTYALLDERAPNAKSLPRDEALVELIRRYFTSHGPATVDDFAWWSGLTKTDTRRGLDMVGKELVSEVIDGKSYWYSASTPSPTTIAPSAMLLPTYDEYVIGYTDRSALFEAPPGTPETNSTKQARVVELFPDAARANIVFDSLIVLSGKIIGTWRRTFSKGAVVIELAPSRAWTPTETEAVNAATDQFGVYLGMPVELTYKSSR
jgi:hypothetical protein